MLDLLRLLLDLLRLRPELETVAVLQHRQPARRLQMVVLWLRVAMVLEWCWPSSVALLLRLSRIGSGVKIKALDGVRKELTTGPFMYSRNKNIGKCQEYFP